MSEETKRQIIDSAAQAIIEFLSSQDESSVSYHRAQLAAAILGESGFIDGLRFRRPANEAE